MNDLRDSRFKSYIEESDFENISLNDFQKTKLLDGETLVTETQNVIMYAPLTDKSKSIFGVLTVTTFKLSFASASVDDKVYAESCCQHNMLLGYNEICLSSIDTIFQVGDRTKKRLIPGSNLSGKVKELYIVCKNMRCFHFSFKHTDKDGGRSIANALLVHAYPKRHNLLFAYEYREPYYRQIPKEVRLFRKAGEWQRELLRTKCQNWRLSDANRNFMVSPNLPQYIIVPSSLTDGALERAVEYFQNRCCPIWVWGTERGAALVRMADLLHTITDRMQENILLENIRKSHINLTRPHIMDLAKECASPKDVQHAYLKLRELCTPDSVRLFKVQDVKMYSLLENSKWLHHVANCLAKANEAARKIGKDNITVVLQEGFNQDMNCVISCLTQLLLDPHWRTISGFQSLVQKDWIALGHPFASRLGHILSQDVEPSPLFLLFLDCLWQLLQQFPSAFEFTETYLTTLWDSTHLSIFETFLFNCEHDRYHSEMPISRSVWSWNEQFSEKDKSFFCNPLYDDCFAETLVPRSTLPYLEIWCQCYFRWLPGLEIRNGGKPQVDIVNKLIVSDIHVLHQRLRGNVNGSGHDASEDRLTLLRKVNSFFPFSHNSDSIHGSLPVSNHLLSNEALDSQSILNLNDSQN